MTLHIGLIGAGNISDTHARAALAIPGVTVAAVFGDNQQKAAALASRYGAACCPSLDALLAHRPLDLVIIGSPSSLHAAQGIAAVRRGLHVLIEKPIDTELPACDTLTAEAEKAEVQLGVIFQDRFKPDLVQLKESIERGDLGRPLLVTAALPWYRPPEYFSESRWRGTIAFDGGGALMNQGIHTVDLLLWLFGDVRKVQARAATLLHNIEVEDTALAILEFANGALGTIQATTAAYPGHARRILVTGSEGSAVVEGDALVSFNVHSQNPHIPQISRSGPGISASSPVIADASAHQRVLEDFLAAMQSGRKPRCDGPDGRRSLALVLAVYEASKSGSTISLR
jgi:UDP-N-acetyl-2-amino-2-deoxyglucuronate dehydrogenase